MKSGKIALAVLTILLGIFFVVFGGYDDSPGAQGIGVIVAILGIVWLVRRIRNK